MHHSQDTRSRVNRRMFGRLAKMLLVVLCAVPASYAQSQELSAPYSISEELFPEYQEPLFITNHVNRILEEHAGNILYPEDVAKIDLSDITPNFSRVYFSTISGRTEVKFNRIEDGYHYFTVSSEAAPNRTSEFRIKGRIYESEVESGRFLNLRRECFFELGPCELKTKPDQEYGAFDRKFLNGVWVNKRKVIGTRGYAYQNIILDKNGIKLYSSTAFGFGREGYDYEILEETSN